MKNTNNISIPYPRPDFEDTKRRLKESLSNQEELKDYDFDGSTLNVLLDVLAYNSVMNAMQLNMAGNESNLQTAIKRSSITGKAQDNGYVPTSARSSRANVFLELTKDSPDDTNGAFIPAGTMFGAMSSGVSYIFSTVEDYYAIRTPNTNIYRADDVNVYEGRPYTHEFTVVAEGEAFDTDSVSDVSGEGIQIPNFDVDTSIMKVSVLDPIVDSTRYVSYTEWSGNISIDDTSRVYFLSESPTGHTTIKFGNDIIGKRPAIGSTIKVEYIISSGPDANGIALFNQSSEVDGFTISEVMVKSASSGGAWAESNESIRFYAPLSFESQNRGVLSSDYEYLAKQAYPAAKGIISWGGEDNIPPMFGKVFISIIPKDGTVLTESDRVTITNFILDKGSVTTKPVLVDPDYIYVDINSVVYYDQGRLQITPTELSERVNDRILQYSDITLGTFKSTLFFSKFANIIDSVDSGIQMNDTKVSISKRIYVSDIEKRQITSYYSNELLPGSITSNTFTYSGFKNCFIGSYGNKLAIYTQRDGVTIMVASNVGSVDFNGGSISINPIDIEVDDSDYFNNLNQKYFISISALPKSQSIFSSKSQILRINNINVESERL